MQKKTLVLMIALALSPVATANPLLGNQPTRPGGNNQPITLAPGQPIPGLGGGVPPFPAGMPSPGGALPPGYGVPGGYEIIGRINDTLVVRSGQNPPLLVQEGKTLPNDCLATTEAILCGPQADEWKAQNQKKVKSPAQAKKEQDELKKLREEWAKERAEMKQEVEQLRLQLVGLAQQLKLTVGKNTDALPVASNDEVFPRAEIAASATPPVGFDDQGPTPNDVLEGKTNALANMPPVVIDTAAKQKAGKVAEKNTDDTASKSVAGTKKAAEPTITTVAPPAPVKPAAAPAITDTDVKVAALDYDQFMRSRYAIAQDPIMKPVQPGVPNTPMETTSPAQPTSRKDTVLDRKKPTSPWLKGKLDGIGEVEYLAAGDDALIFRVNQYQAKLLSPYARDMTRDGLNFLVTVDMNRVNQAGPDPKGSKE